MQSLSCEFMQSLSCEFMQSLSCEFMQSLSCEFMQSLSFEFMQSLSCEFIQFLSCEFMQSLILTAISLKVIPMLPSYLGIGLPRGSLPLRLAGKISWDYIPAGGSSPGHPKRRWSDTIPH